MKKILFIFILFLFIINFVSATLTEAKLEQATGKMSEICNEWTEGQIREFIISKDCTFGQHIAISTNCGSKDIQYRCDDGTHSIWGVDLTTLPDVQILDSNINVGSPNTTQTIDKSQTNFNFKVAFEISLTILGISIIGNLIQFVVNRKKKEKVVKFI